VAVRTRLTVRRASGDEVRVVVTTDAGATVGDVADALAPDTTDGTLHVEHPDGTVSTLARDAAVADVALRAGSSVVVVGPGHVRSRAGRARLQVVTGPAAGLDVELRGRVATLGRGEDCDVVIDDPMVSRTHARVLVGAHVEIVDAGSSNGIVVGGGRVDRAVVGPSDYVLLGDSVLSVRALDEEHDAPAPGPAVAFNRPPRVVPPVTDRRLEAPTVPEPLPPGRLPVVALVAPLVMGLMLFVFLRSTLTLVLLALSPLIVVGTYVDRRIGDRRKTRRQQQEFRAALDVLADELSSAQAHERAERHAELAATADVVASVADLGDLLWSRRREHPTFLTLRLGVGTVPSRTVLTMPTKGSAVPALWAALDDVRARFTDVTGVPVAADLAEVGAVGVAGDAADEVARALVAQVVGLHSPAELVVAALASPLSHARWDWLTWLPHVDSPHSPLSGAHLAAHPAAAAPLVARLEELVAERLAAPGGPAVLLVVEDDTVADRARLVRLAEMGPSAGVHVLWCATSADRLPAACRAFVVAGRDGAARGAVLDGTWTPMAPERLDAPLAEQLARRLSAVVDAGAPVLDQSDLPRSIGFLDLVGAQTADSATAVLERWHETGSVLDRHGPPQRRRHDTGLRAVVGAGAGGQFVLDLRAQGPHALVGGTTGAGKSEFLQSWVLGLATAYGPDRVTFLFVDYKGGAAFADCTDLPHCVGLVTDLSPALVRRALTSLRAELRRREHLFNRKGVKDLLELERTSDPDTPPALVIVVDEFAALVAEVPEFVDGVVDVAQRGRSLGLHLILATQRPAGVIKDNLRANTNLRIALRMADEHDSTDVLGSALAASFDPGIPGRGAVRTGPGRVAMFQAGYAGGCSSSGPRRAGVRVEHLVFGPGVPWELRPTSATPRPDDDGPTDIERVVATVRAAALDIPAPRRPWLPALPDVVDLASLGGAFAVGMADLPAQQEQRELCLRPDEDGGLVVLGTSGSGKSTVLRTIAAACAGTPTHVYGLDLGAGGLAMLEALPHVGAVIDGADTERTVRLLRRLRDELDDRATRFAAAHAGTITQYRELAGRPDEPRIVLLVDGLAAFRDGHEADAARTGTWAAFQRVVTEGRPLGIHVVMAAERPNALPTSLAGSVGRRLVLRQADDGAYGLLGVPKDVLGPGSPPGRGVFAGEVDELQVAVVGGTSSPAGQAAALRQLAAASPVVAPGVERLPTFVALSGLPAAVDGGPVVGVADDTLRPVGFDARGTFLLAGPSGSGRTTALEALAAAVRRWSPDAPLYYVGNRRSPVHSRGRWAGVALDPAAAAELAREVLAAVTAPADPDRPVVLVVEGLADLLGGPAEQVLTEVVRAARRGDHLVIAEGETTGWGSSWPLVAEVRAGRRGLLLQPDHLDGDALFRTPFPRMARADFPAGRGVFVEGGRVRRVQVPVANQACG